MDELRARAYLDIFLGHGLKAGQPAGNGAAGPVDGDGGRRSGPAGGDGGRAPAGPAADPAGPLAGVIPAGFAGQVTLTIPLATLTGRADRPGEIAGIGPIDPWLARDLARAAAAQPPVDLVRDRDR